MTYKWTAIRPTITLNESGGTDTKSALISARDFIHADTMLRDIFSEPFSLQIFDETGKKVFNDSQLTLQKLDEIVGT
jgi:hypothetical protein